MKPYYQDDAVTIYHGDATIVRAADIGAYNAAALITDPPYGIGVKTEWTDRRPGPWAKDSAPIAGDDEPFDPRGWLNHRTVVLWGANHYADRLPPSPSWLVWDKRRGGTVTPGWNAPDAELAWTNTTVGVRVFQHLWEGYKRDSEIGYHVHPTQKPVALMRWVLELVTKPGDLVFDPFMGSGPLARACKDMGRRYVGCELVEAYCAAAVARLGQGVLDLSA